jgi:hypothetical protein
MSKKIAPRVQLNFAPDETEHVSDEEGLISDEELDLPCEVPDVIERKKIVQNDIFDNVNPSLNGMGEDMIIEEDEPPPAPRKKLQKQTDTAKPQVIKDKPKRKLSDEHAAKLALAREKALATRRAKAEEKKKMKKIEDETKELKKKKAQKDLETLKDEVIHNKPSLQNQQISNNTFTRQELEDAQLDAIMKYEAIRKARKEEKRKQQLIDQQKEQLKQKIQGYGARDANGRLLNKWDRCY